MKSWVVFCSVALVALASFPAVAQQTEGQGGRRFGPGGPGHQGPPQRVPAREEKGDNRGGRNMHMTPEQRQQLRRDIHDHGRDIYRERGEARRRR